VAVDALEDLLVRVGRLAHDLPEVARLDPAGHGGRMPAGSLARTTKAAFGAVFTHGLRSHHDQIAALAEDSRLVALGLADQTALRRACSRHSASATFGIDLAILVAAENWLRALPHADHTLQPATGHRPHPPESTP
ncbi:hypothetical protein ACWEPC_54525, partial [Nonomuraea sp. NPDC004297]